jgi:hypothetical protein
MPETHPSANRSKNASLGDAARHGMIVMVRCGSCGKKVNYWAADLLQVVGPRHNLHQAPFPCATCKSSDCLTVRWEVPSTSTLDAGLIVRRPVKQVMRWIWRNERA